MTKRTSPMTSAAVRASDFQNSAAYLARSGAPQNLKFEREDWALFRTVEGLQQKAGVPKQKLRRLTLKELVENGLDESERVRVGELPDGGYFVEDDGKGIAGTPDEIAGLFSISRPLVSTKLLRLPTRGALGNGLRVVAGAVLASSGVLVVVTRNRRIELQPQHDGTTKVLRTTEGRLPNRHAGRDQLRSGAPRRFPDAALGRTRHPLRTRQDVRRKIEPLVVRRSAIP
jgi:hypothetical protein